MRYAIASKANPELRLARITLGRDTGAYRFLLPEPLIGETVQYLTWMGAVRAAGMYGGVVVPA